MNAEMSAKINTWEKCLCEDTGMATQGKFMGKIIELNSKNVN